MKYSLAVLAIFKNESMIIKEWIEHYIWQGVEHFYLINNDSSDNYLNIIQPYINKGLIDLYHFPEKHKQEEHHNKVFNLIKQDIEWLIVCDLDEFWFGVKKNLSNYIKELPKDINRIKLYWDLFGSSGYDKQPENIRTSFVYRKSEQIRTHSGFSKCILKANETILLDVHDHYHKNYDFSRSPKTNYKDTINEWKTVYDDLDNIRLFHYQIMSKEYFSKVKMSRGDNMYEDWDSLRSWEYFNERDYNEIPDYTLSNLVINGYSDN